MPFQNIFVKNNACAFAGRLKVRFYAKFQPDY